MSTTVYPGVNNSMALVTKFLPYIDQMYKEGSKSAILDTANQPMSAVTTGTVSTATTQFDGVKKTFDIDAMGIGGIGIVSAPVEMFDTTSMAIREKSPYDVTFVLYLCNGSNGYLPTEICYDYIDCYECRGGNFKAGDAERIVDIYVDLLNQAKG